MALPGCGEIKGPFGNSDHLVRCEKYSGVFSYWGSRLKKGGPVGGKWVEDGNACAPCLDGNYRICTKDNNVHRDTRCYRIAPYTHDWRTGDQENLCGACKGSSFESGVGNSTYYAFCAKPVELAGAKNVTNDKNNSLSRNEFLKTQYATLENNVKSCKERKEELEGQKLRLQNELKQSHQQVKEFQTPNKVPQKVNINRSFAVF